MSAPLKKQQCTWGFFHYFRQKNIGPEKKWRTVVIKGTAQTFRVRLQRKTVFKDKEKNENLEQISILATKI